MREAYIPGGAVQVTRQLREQLNEMMAAAQALGRRLDADGKAGEYLAVLNRGLCRQLRLVRLLDLESRLNDPDEIRLRHAPVDLVALCRGLMERADRLTAGLNIRAQFACELAALPTLADEHALEEMLLALIAHSVKAVGRDGWVRLELGRQQGKAVLALTDSAGMDAGTLAGLTAPPEEDGDDLPGSGLTLAQQVAALHGGILVADSGEERGARLVVSIPVLERLGGALRSPGLLPTDETGGWDRVLVALSECLPAEIYAPGAEAPER